ncbi:MAG: F0F1 ATP synthase subunit delta [Bacteriovoracaceae bacterium]|nr:F0F1 ATP synthase subunit delta [Bacteriovoracaceae bacterium]
MKEAIVARAYAQSIYTLGEEQKIDVTEEMTNLTMVINENNNLETVLFLDVFTIEEKQAVLNDVLVKLGLSGLVKNVLNFLMEEKRINILPLIFKELVVLDDHKKGFMRGIIEGREGSVDKEFETKIHAFLKEKLGTDPILTYKQNEKLTAGFRVTVEDLQLDATLDNQLNKLKSEILNS